MLKRDREVEMFGVEIDGVAGCRLVAERGRACRGSSSCTGVTCDKRWAELQSRTREGPRLFDSHGGEVVVTLP